MCWFVLLAYLAVRGHQYTVGKPSSRRRRKKRERKEGERESGSYFGIKSTVFTRSKPVPNNSWHRLASTGAEATREKEHIGENPTSKAPLSMENATRAAAKGGKKGPFLAQNRPIGLYRIYVGTHPVSHSLTVVSRQSPPGPGQAPGVMRRATRAQATCGRHGGTTPTAGANGSRLLLYSI